MIGIHIALARGCPIRYRDWSLFYYAELAKGRDSKPKLYRCYPDGHLEILDTDLSDLCREDGWLILGPPSDQPPSPA